MFATKNCKTSPFSLDNWEFPPKTRENTYFSQNGIFFAKIDPKWLISLIWENTEKVRILVRISTGLYGQNTGFVRVHLAVRKKYVFFPY